MGTFRTLVAASVAAFLVVLAVMVPAVADRSRVEQMRGELGATGVYLEPAQAMGEVELWRERLRAALDAADLGVDGPVAVGLWTYVEGLPPEYLPGSSGDGLLVTLGLEGGVLLTASNSNVTAIHDLPVDETGVLRAMADATEAIADRLLAASPDPDRFSRLSAVARLWIFLRLAAVDPPPPLDLVEELSGDTSLLHDTARPPLPERRPTDDFAPITLVLIGIGLLITSALIVRQLRAEARRRRAEAEDEPAVDPMATNLTRLVVLDELAALSEAIAASERAPGDPHFDRAQACADAASAFAASDAERDRIGVHFLVADGQRALGGWSRGPRCFFHPAHRASTSVTRAKVALPCCAACAEAVAAGQRPESLMLTGPDGRVRGYYEVDDVWTATGYGAIDERWARRVLLTSLEAR